MDATFRYNSDEVRGILLAHHEQMWPKPPGYKWVAVSDAYGSLAVKMELIEEKAKEGEEI